MLGLLAFDKAPPFAAPLRFFLTAPLFLALAGFLVLIEGENIFASRWMPPTLAVTHLLTVGFMLICMFGALIQILPVVAGASIERPLLVAGLVHGGLTTGTLALAAAFIFGDPLLFMLAAALLAVAVLIFLFAAGRALWAVPSTSPTIGGLKLSLFGAFGVALLGVWLALGLAEGWALPLVDMANLHAAWGFAAWGGILLAAISYVAVPMFQLTPPYRTRPSWWLPRLILVICLLWALALPLEAVFLTRLAEGALALLGGAFALVTLRLQSQRRRARVDAPTLYWRWGLSSALAALAMSLVAALVPEAGEWAGWGPLFGILLVLGGFVSLIVGMLYRIVPFLAWLHLQPGGSAPSIGKILPEPQMRPQMWWHFATVLLCAAATWQAQWLARAAGLALVVDGLWLLFNLLAALRAYRGCLRQRRESAA